jgi:eukaryotic-like serine/threonine-protein kinase
LHTPPFRPLRRSLDEVLSTPFRIKMYESPYLKLVSSDQYAQALKSHPDASLSDELEICRRLHARVLLTGEVVPAGQNFEVRVNAYDCVQTTRVAAATVRASSPDNLLTALQAACNKMRLRLGESRATLNRFDVSLVKATTSSLAALRAYRLGEQQHLSGNDAESKTYFKLAIDLDPKFALAYLQLGRAYSNTGESSLSRSYYQHAFDLRERTTDRERLYITTSYYSYATGERERAIEAYQLWSMLYPQDVIPPNNLAGEYLAIGQPHEALRSARRALELDPSLPQPHAVVAEALLATGDSSTLQAMCDDSVRQATIGGAAYHLTCYNAAFVRHDDYAMQREMTWARGKSLECVFINATAEIALYHGRLDESHRLFDAARQSALANNLPEFAARMGLNEAAMEAELGLLTAARHDVLDALAIGPDGSAEEATAALVWALLGDLERANEAMRKANTQSPLDTLLNHAAIPEVQAVIDLKRNQPEEALRQLEQVRPYDLCQSMDLTPGYYRGVAYLQSGQPERAAAEFRNVLSHRATASHSLYVLLSQLQLAKILSQSEDPGAAVVLTRELEENWQEADLGFAPRRDLRTLTTRPRRN